MKLWTVQNAGIVNAIANNGSYQPIFKESDYVRRDPDLAVLYNTVLNNFNKIHNSEFPGLVFCFTGADENNNPCEIPDYEAFKTLIRSKKEVIESLWNHLVEGNTVVLEIDIDETFNPMYIDINDFQCLMPPILELPPYDSKEIDNIIKSIHFGIYRRSPLPSGIIQAHIPQLFKEIVTKIYPTFDFE